MLASFSNSEIKGKTLVSGNKEAVNALHKSNHVISYNGIRIRMQNIAWARIV